MRRLGTAIVLAVLLSVATFDGAYGQSPYRDTKPPTTTETLRQPVIDDGGQGFSGLLDLSRLSMDHQFGMGYMSSGGRGYTQGYYLNTLTYRFNAPVLLRLRTGVTNNPFAQSGSMTRPGQSAMSAFFNNAEFFGGADLLWKPSENTRLMISVERTPPGMFGGGRYVNPYGSPGFWNRGGFGAYHPAYGFDDPGFDPHRN
ncbi:MAG: hypothetical protein MAG453_01799 [Calditrichaeota bacterium]|nr:hypothetical protein [Calditrichota bacterium]